MTGKKSKRVNHFSPSEHHQYIMSRTKQSMGYDGSDVKRWQIRLRRKLRELVGEMPVEKSALDVRSVWQKEHKLGSIEKIIFTSEPFCDVPAYVCIPKGAKRPLTFMICVQGHSSGMHNSIAVRRDDESKKFNVGGDRDFGIACMRNGIAALCIEQRCFGERMERRQEMRSDRRCHDAVMHSLMLGRTLIGERVYDVDRAIDYLAGRGDVEMKHIGIMGDSGGGTISMFGAALLKRISFAVPACYFCTFSDSSMSIYHCECNYIPKLLKYAEMSDIMGLFAPKPVVIVAGKEDPIFPIAGVRKSFKKLKQIYRSCGAEKHCHLVVGEGGHRFYTKDAWPVIMKEIKRLQGV